MATVEEIANKASGTYAQAIVVLEKAADYASAARDAGDGWFISLPGQTSRQLLVENIEKERQVLGSYAYPEGNCPDWLTVRNMLFQARAEYAAVDEGKRRVVDNLVQLPADLIESAGEVAGELAETAGGIVGAAGEIAGKAAGGLLGGLGLPGMLLLAAVGVGAFYVMKKGSV